MLSKWPKTTSITTILAWNHQVNSLRFTKLNSRGSYIRWSTRMLNLQICIKGSRKRKLIVRLLRNSVIQMEMPMLISQATSLTNPFKSKLMIRQLDTANSSKIPQLSLLKLWRVTDLVSLNKLVVSRAQRLVTSVQWALTFARANRSRSLARSASYNSVQSPWTASTPPGTRARKR